MSLDTVELVMALEEFGGLAEIDSETTLGDVHWLLVSKERERDRRPGQTRRSSERIWLALSELLEGHGVPPAQIKPQTRI